MNNENNTSTNGMAIASLISSTAGALICCLGPVLGVIFGHIAISQINKTGQQGRGLALGGLITGYSLLAVYFLIYLLIFVFGMMGQNW